MSEAKENHAPASPPGHAEPHPRDGDPCPRCNGTGVTQTMAGPGICLYRNCANGTYQSDPAAA